MTTKRKPTLALTVKCMSKRCGEKRVIYAGTPEALEQPMCQKCFMPMIAVSAKGSL